MSVVKMQVTQLVRFMVLNNYLTPYIKYCGLSVMLPPKPTLYDVSEVYLKDTLPKRLASQKHLTTWVGTFFNGKFLKISHFIGYVKNVPTEFIHVPVTTNISS